MNISTLVNKTTSFVKSNLSANNDFGSVEDNRAEAKRVDGELERIHQDAVDIRDGLATIKEDSKLEPPTMADVSKKDLLKATTAGGAVIGGILGMGSNILGGGSGNAVPVETTVNVYEDQLAGKGFTANVYVGANPGEPAQGWEFEIHQSKPQSVKVDEYTTESLRSSGARNIALSGALGMAGGAAIGLAGGFAFNALRKINPEAEEREIEGENKVIIGAGVAGAAIGAGAGFLSALTNTGEVEITTRSHEMETAVIGQAPRGMQPGERGFYIPNNGEFDDPTVNLSSPPAMSEKVALVEEYMDMNKKRLERNGALDVHQLEEVDVKGQVPKKTLFGNVKIDEKTEKVNVGPGMMASVAGGAAIGAASGVAGGILMNVLRKSL